MKTLICLAMSACVFCAQPVMAQLRSVTIVSGLTMPVAVVQDPSQPHVQFVVEQGGLIRVVRNGVLQTDNFLDLRGVVLSGGERGLLGLAFAPDYATSRRFFVNFTRKPDGNTVIARFVRSSSDPLRADPASRFDLTWPGGQSYIVQPFANHNAGDLQFGSDGFLYIPLGDGGNANDPGNRAQDPHTLLGKVLRIDVDVPDADFEGYDVPASNPFVGRPGYLPEIWDFGMRNPFRTTVDSIARGGMGALVMGDVGQNAWEEIDYEPYGAAGRNYGWRYREGAHNNVTTLPPAYTPLTEPIFEYSHAVGNVITGGVVYRGTALGVGSFGRYFFADFGARRIWSLGLHIDPITHRATAGNLIEHTADLGGAAVIGNVSAFGTGANCEIYFLNYSAGQLRRIVNAVSGPAAMCPTSPDPFFSSGGGVFVSASWVSRDNPAARGAGTGVPAGGCTTVKPGSDWVCVAGNWLPPNFPTSGGSTGGTGGTTGGSTGVGSSTCTTVKPGAGWVCVGRNWLPPNYPLAGSGSASGGTTGTSGGSTGGSATCTTVKPASDWVCVAGNWLPPTHPLATGGSSGTSSGGTAGGAACTTVKPGADWVCVNGNWLPPR
jgi:glucose/arabinose dehydrogenase